jgi:hypothetical protein
MKNEKRGIFDLYNLECRKNLLDLDLLELEKLKIQISKFSSIIKAQAAKVDDKRSGGQKTGSNAGVERSELGDVRILKLKQQEYQQRLSHLSTPTNTKANALKDTFTTFLDIKNQFERNKLELDSLHDLAPNLTTATLQLHQLKELLKEKIQQRSELMNQLT